MNSTVETQSKWVKLLHEYDTTWNKREIPLKERVLRCSALHQQMCELAEVRSVPNANENQPATQGNKSTSESDLTKLRIRVAELLGWKQKLWDKDERGRPLLEPILQWFHPSDPFWSKYPQDLPTDYPSDLNAAIQLCDVLKEEGWKFTALMNYDGRWSCAFLRYRNKKAESVVGKGDTLSSAICEAFVKTMEGRSVQGGNEKG